MKITKITNYWVRMPLVSPFETSFGSISHRECIISKIEAGDVTGYGECPADQDPGYSYETTSTAWPIMKDYLVPAILGKPLPTPEDYVKKTSFVRGHPMAKSGLEMALWDIAGKMKGQSLQQMLNGKTTKIPVGVSVGLQSSPAVLVDTVGNYINNGYGRIKLKIKPGRDVGDVTAVRKSFPAIKLQVDANSAYTLENALSALIPLDSLNLLLIEQPLSEDDLWDHSKLQRHFKTAICLDESIVSSRHARQAIEMQACRVINIKQGRVGGLLAAVEIHNDCLSKNVPVWCGGMLETGVGRAANLALASLPNFTLPGDISATDRYYHEDITLERFELNNDSTIDVPRGPGLGININSPALDKYSLKKESFTA